jgi:hypothetical protein
VHNFHPELVGTVDYMAMSENNLRKRCTYCQIAYSYNNLARHMRDCSKKHLAENSSGRFKRQKVPKPLSEGKRLLDHYGDWANLSHSNTVVQESIL